ncbi:diadenylate cyclase CdaA [Hydrogenoanaerobacterium sp.]|uniref:diadenylate cyclase CdaA n=1 Tax=Hydrogenoanaerobacterium sp. TaxID=2953763 RepID=UPI002899280E|nr:diadenylate cyclase CdaA [Hydrogenoanaerobacterium sp.]
MEILDNFWLQFAGSVKAVGIVDIIDMLFVAYLIYKLAHFMKETRAAQLVKGLIVYIAAFLIAIVADMRTVRFIMEYLLNNGLIVLVVVFQPELRRALEQVGRSKLPIGLFSSHTMSEEAVKLQWQNAISSICEAASSLSRTQTGALIVIEQQTKLGDIIKTGTVIDSDPSMELIGNVFFPNSPLHDGAMIIRAGRLHAAGCFLPLSTNYEISKQLGTRHRAALGMSENSDAIIVVVSEETGYISVARNGVLNINLSIDQLRKTLEETILKEDKEEKGEKKLGFWKVKNK